MRRFTAINYYALLGVTSEATRDEIRSAYRVKVRAAHPDHGGDPELFAQIAEAWEVLGSESERTIYDADRKLRMRSARPYSTRLPREKAPPRDSDFAPNLMALSARTPAKRPRTKPRTTRVRRCRRIASTTESNGCRTSGASDPCLKTIAFAEPPAASGGLKVR